MHTAIDFPLEKMSGEMMSLQRCGKEEYMYERKQSERKGMTVSGRERSFVEDCGEKDHFGYR